MPLRLSPRHRCGAAAAASRRRRFAVQTPGPRSARRQGWARRKEARTRAPGTSTPALRAPNLNAGPRCSLNAGGPWRRPPYYTQRWAVRSRSESPSRPRAGPRCGLGPGSERTAARSGLGQGARLSHPTPARGPPARRGGARAAGRECRAGSRPGRSRGGDKN